MVKATRDISDEKAHQNATVQGGVHAAAYGLGAGLVGSFAAQRAGVKAYRSLTLPLKAFALTSVTTAAFIIGADSASRNYELKKYQIGSGTALERESREGIAAEQQAGIGGQSRQKVDLSKLSTKDMLVEWGKEHRYGTVFAAWAASMVGSFGYISMTPLSFAQKLVQARMVAQGLTVAVLIASAGLSSIPTAAGGQNEDELKREAREQGMYKWKAGSPHEKQQQHEASKSA